MNKRKLMLLVMLSMMAMVVSGQCEVSDMSCQTQGSDRRSADVVAYQSDGSSVSCKISADVPGQGLVQAVGEWMDEVLGGSYTGDVRDVQALVQYYGRAMTDTLQQESKELGSSMQMVYDAQIRKVCETDQWVTYTMTSYVYLGGAHPSSAFEGATFRKSDGRKLGWDIISRDKRDAFYTLMVKSLKQCLNVASDEELERAVNRSVYEIPLPQRPPFLSAQGMTFVYQQYELGSYSVGMPTATIPNRQLLPLLTRWVACLVK